jgi:steroid 5-alpha-reductase/3-oxo-5-alpha-steroid 4-dehydrogenase 1
VTALDAWHTHIAWGVIVVAVIAFVALHVLPAPYGRHASPGWGPSLSPKIGWLVMESPAVLVFAAVYVAGQHRAAPVPLALFVVWQLHYVDRALLYPMRIAPGAKRMAVAVVAMGFAFQVVNAWLNARWISQLASYGGAWLYDPRFIAGVALFALGRIANTRADATLAALQRRGQGYQIPHGGLYRYVSCPNYLGEIVPWCAWALMSWSLAGVAFAAFTIANLAPRARSHHAWYRARFVDYPRERRALVPFLW